MAFVEPFVPEDYLCLKPAAPDDGDPFAEDFAGRLLQPAAPDNNSDTFADDFAGRLLAPAEWGPDSGSLGWDKSTLSHDAAPDTCTNAGMLSRQSTQPLLAAGRASFGAWFGGEAMGESAWSAGGAGCDNVPGEARACNGFADMDPFQWATWAVPGELSREPTRGVPTGLQTTLAGQCCDDEVAGEVMRRANSILHKLVQGATGQAGEWACFEAGPGAPLLSQAQGKLSKQADVVSNEVRRLEFEAAILRSKIQKMQGVAQGAQAAKETSLRTIKKGLGKARHSRRPRQLCEAAC